MHRNTKVATCCYCGTRAALVLDAGRHELVCSGCGAPLHELKAMPVTVGQGKGGDGGSAYRSADFHQTRRPDTHAMTKVAKRAGKKFKKRKSKSKRFFEEAFDFIEDIFD